MHGSGRSNAFIEGITHMMMDGSDEGRGYDSNDIMEMIPELELSHMSPR